MLHPNHNAAIESSEIRHFNLPAALAKTPIGRADARWLSRLFLARGGLAGPRQFAFDFELQREAEEGAN